MPRLTQDILDIIVDALAGNPLARSRYDHSATEIRQTLENCALASSTLRRRAQAHLLQVFVIDKRTRAIIAKKMSAERPELALHVKMLYLHPGAPRRDEDWMYSDGEYGLGRVLPLFPNVTRVDLDNLSLDNFVHNKIRIEDVFASLRSARIHTLTCATWDRSEDAQFTALLQTVKHSLRYLELKYCDWKTSAQGMAHDVGAFCSPETLTVEALYGTSGINYPWFSCLDVRSLKTLEFNLVIDTDVRAWQQVIDNAPQITTVLISEVVRYPHQLDLHELRQLQNLELSGQMWNYSMQGDNLCPIIPLLDIVGTVASTQLAKLTIKIEHDQSGVYRRIDWNNAQFHRERLRELNPAVVVTFILHGRVPRGGPETHIHDAVAEMRAAAEAEGLEGEAIQAEITQVYVLP